MTPHEKDQLVYLLQDNKYIFHCMRTSLYNDEEDKSKAISTYEENHKQIEKILGLSQHWEDRMKQQAAKTISDIKENKEYIEELTGLIKDTFADIRGSAVGIDPYVDLSTEPDITREQWDETIKNQEEYFKVEYEQLKVWYAEAVAEPSKFDWAPFSKTEPTKTEIILDENIISLAAGYMVGPVGLFRGRAVAAQVQKFDNISEMEIFLKAQAKFHDLVIYIAFKKEGKYFWRGALVNKI